MDISEIVRIIGKRQGQSSYDTVCIIPQTAKFDFSDMAISIPIPSTSTSTSVDSKTIPLRRITRKATISGYLVDGNDGFSALAVTTTNFDADGTVTGGTAITSVLKKKWALEEMFNQGAAGEGMTLQYRGVIVPSANPQTSPPTAPSDETKNMWHKLGKIVGLTITDDANFGTSPQSTFTRYLPTRMSITITVQWGSVQT